MVQLRPSVAIAGQAVLLMSLAAGATAVHLGHAQAQPPTTTKPVAPAAPAATAVSAAVPRCDRSQLRGRTARYEGGSVSATYDKVFRPWAWVPFLKTHVPQALTTWRNWDGVGHNLVLLGMYRRGHHSLLVGFDPASGRPTGTVEINQSHLGGMGFVGRWLFAQDNADADSHATVRRYRIDQLRAAMRKATHGGNDRPFLRMDGKPRRIDAIDFFAEEGNSVYAGNHGSERTARMYRYTLSADGHLQRAEGPWRIPPRAQGLVITPRLFIFSTSHGRPSVRLRLDPGDAGGHDRGRPQCAHRLRERHRAVRPTAPEQPHQALPRRRTGRTADDDPWPGPDSAAARPGTAPADRPGGRTAATGRRRPPVGGCPSSDAPSGPAPTPYSRSPVCCTDRRWDRRNGLARARLACRRARTVAECGSLENCFRG